MVASDGEPAVCSGESWRIDEEMLIRRR